MNAKVVRAKACEYARAMVAEEGIREDVMSRLWAYAVFFESYIHHGSAWTLKNVIEADRPTAEILQMVENRR